jgi:hypothetical protein
MATGAIISGTIAASQQVGTYNNQSKLKKDLNVNEIRK